MSSGSRRRPRKKKERKKLVLAVSGRQKSKRKASDNNVRGSQIFFALLAVLFVAAVFGAWVTSDYWLRAAPPENPPADNGTS